MTSAFLTSIARPASAGSSRNGDGNAARSVVSTWCDARSDRRSNQNDDKPVSTRPLSVTGSFMTTSNALIRSVATSRT